MTRRIVRTLIQLSAALVFGIIVVLFLDRNYRVLPVAIHNHLPSHHPGSVIVDVEVAKCSKINFLSNCQLEGDGWIRLDKELYLGLAWSESYMYIKRKHEEDLTSDDKVVIDIKIGRLDANLQAPTPKGTWEPRSHGIWLLRSDKKISSDSGDAITAIDVLFGDDAVEVRDNWEIRAMPLIMSRTKKQHSVHVTVRRGMPVEHKVPKLKIPKGGKFKILQVADLHLSTGVGACREPVPAKLNGYDCLADPRTLEFVNQMIMDEKPDFVVLSGDQVNGESSPDTQSAMFKIIALLKEHKLPWAAIFGNHDDSPQGLSREAQMEIMETLPYSMATAGPADVDGVGNYVIEVGAESGADHSAITMYFLDTHAYSPDEKHYPGYGWIKPSQIEWFKKTAQGLKKKHQEYSLTHLDISFIHIPLTEYTNWTTGPWVGQWREGVTAPKYNSGFRDALVEQGVVMVSAGHDHANDYCLLSPEGEGDKRVPALWMCYAGGVGLGGYGGYKDYVRRVRVFEINPSLGSIVTWKRMEYGEKGRIDEHMMVQGGRALPPPAPPPSAEPTKAVPPPPPPPP